MLEEGEIRRLGGREPKKIDVRVLAATGRPMEQAVERSEFRSDLYYRLNVVRLHIPPLRERPEDIPELLTHFARQVAQRLGHPVSITPAALAALTQHNWPGNVRELRNAVERAAVLSAGGLLDCKDFSLSNGTGASPTGGASGSAGSQDPGRGSGAGSHSARSRGLQWQPAAGGEPAGHQSADAVLQAPEAAAGRLDPGATPCAGLQPAAGSLLLLRAK